MDRVSAEGSAMTLRLDREGLVRLSWAPGARITGDAARAAMTAVDDICAGRPRPLLVDMTTAQPVTREARAVFGQKCSASIIALLGRSPVDRVIANFVLGVNPPPVPTRFFNDEAEAVKWLRDGLGDEPE